MSKSGEAQDTKNMVKEPAAAAPAAPAPADKVKNDIKISNDKAVREFIDKIPGILKTYLENNVDKPVKTSWWGGKKGKTRRMKKGRKGTKRR